MPRSRARELRCRAWPVCPRSRASGVGSATPASVVPCPSRDGRVGAFRATLRGGRSDPGVLFPMRSQRTSGVEPTRSLRVLLPRPRASGGRGAGGSSRCGARGEARTCRRSGRTIVREVLRSGLGPADRARGHDSARRHSDVLRSVLLLGWRFARGSPSNGALWCRRVLDALHGCDSADVVAHAQTFQGTRVRSPTRGSNSKLDGPMTLGGEVCWSMCAERSRGWLRAAAS